MTRKSDILSEHSLLGTDVRNDVHKNNDFIAPTSVSTMPLSHSNLSDNDLVINTENEFMVGSGIPKTFYVNSSLISTNKGQYDEYKFPSKDGPLSEAGMIDIPKIDSLEYNVNLFVGKLDLDLKKEWDELAGRDTSVPEISSHGLQLTQYDIRHQCALFRKARDKEMYVHNLSENLSDELSPKNTDKQPNGGSFPTQSHPVEIFAAKIRAPTEGLSFEFLLSCRYDQQKFGDKLLSLILNKQHVELLSLLGQIDKHFLYKKHRKKPNKFRLLIEKGRKLCQFKINYYI